MKKILSFVLAFFLVFALVGCNECEHKFVNGKCEECGEAHDCVYENGKCECGKAHDCVYEDGKCECGKEESHEHEFVNGSCACGELHDCEYVDGKCECGKEEVHEHEFVNGSCACGEPHNCKYVDGKCECGKEEEVVVNKYTVTFKDKDGNVIEAVEVEEGNAATAPTAPAVDGFVFKGWDKEFSNVTANLEVTAVYEAEAPKVTPGTIAEIVAAEDGLFETIAIVVATNAQSFLIKDETGAMLVYKGSEWTCDVAVGDKVKVNGNTSIYGNAKQFAQDATYEKVESVTVEYGEAKELTAADCDAYATLEKVTVEYVSFVGTLSVSGGKYFNVRIDGATIIGSLTYPADVEAVKALNGKKIVVTGYVTGVTSKYLNIMFTEVAEPTYSVKFENAEVEAVEVKEGDKVAKPADPVKEGYNFVGWYADAECTVAYDFEQVVKADLVLYAKFEEIVYTISYNLSGGKCDNLVTEFKNASEVTLPTPTKEGNDFLGWFENGVQVTALENKNYELVARWETSTYTITYDLDGGVCNSLVNEFKHNEDVTLPIPTKDGYAFEGWYEGETLVEEVTNKDYSLKAKWRVYTAYKVIYDLDGGVFTDGWKTSAEIGKAFYDDFNKYRGDNDEIPFESFHYDSHPAIKTSLTNAEMLAKWNWLWKYMLADLKAYNGSSGGSYVSDTYTALERMINGDTEVMASSDIGPNARTLIRSYMHGVMHNMKGCGTYNATFAAYSPDFSDPEVQKGLVLNQFATEVELEQGIELPIPAKDGYAFAGWYDANGNKVTIVTGELSVKAKWEETVVVESIEITNKVSDIELLKTHQLTWNVAPADAINKLVKFESSNEKVVTVSPEGLITAVGKGTATITIKSLSSSGKTDSFEIKVTAPGYFDISYETNSYVGLGEEIKLNAEYIDGDNKPTIVWATLDSNVATVKDGVVTGVNPGVVTIRAIVDGNDETYQDFTVTVLSDDVSDALQLVLDSHESNIFVRYELPIGAGTPNYYKDIFGSISKLLYNEELVIDTTYNQATNDKYGDTLESRKMKSIEFITVHYTAGFNATAGGAAHGAYFAQPLSQNSTSIHYSTGNDGIYKGLDEQYRAAHAGDDGSFNTVPNGFEWIDTNVEVLDSDPKHAVITITSNATFAINGRDTGVKVPEETKYNRGYVTDSKWLNDQGIAVNVKDGKYQVGTTWWCYTQVAEGRICSNGGNANSIGIESAVNYGSDLWYTWQKTAMLVADIMIRYNLDITKVKGHHFFAAKDCPQPMLENDLEIWWEFIELVEAEYEKATKFKEFTFEFKCESDLVDNHGRVVKQNLHSEIVTYTVDIITDNAIETVTLSSVIEGVYAK